jgi:hypothetical protein
MPTKFKQFDKSKLKPRPQIPPPPAMPVATPPQQRRQSIRQYKAPPPIAPPPPAPQPLPGTVGYQQLPNIPTALPTTSIPTQTQYTPGKPAPTTPEIRPPTASGIPFPTIHSQEGYQQDILNYVNRISGQQEIYLPNGAIIGGPIGPKPSKGEVLTDWYAPPYSAAEHPEKFNPGYEPTFWEDPRNVGRAYWQMKGQVGIEPYPWMDQQKINDAYEYFKLANGTDDWTSWKYLSPDDPARGYLQSFEMPPLDYYVKPKQYQQILTLDLLATPAEQRDPQLMNMLAPGYRWYIENEDYSKQVQAWVLENTPDWMNFVSGLMSDPAWSSTISMGGFGLITGGIPGAVIMGLTGLVTGLSEKIPNEALSSAVGTAAFIGGLGFAVPEIGIPLALIAGAGAGIYTSITGNNVTDWLLSKFMWGAEQTKALIGTAYQLGGATLNPEDFGSVDEVLNNLNATWQAGKLSYANLATSRKSNGLQNIIPALAYAWDYATGNTEDMAKIKFAAPGETFSYMNKITGERYSPLPHAVDATYAAIFTGARRLIMAGNDPTEVLMYYQSQLGIPGEIADLIGMMILNPLNYSSHVESAAIRQLGRMTDQQAIVEGWSGKQGLGIFGGLKNYRAMVMSGKWGVLDGMTSFERMLGGLSENGIPIDLDPNYHITLKGEGKIVASANGVIRYLEPLFAMTPESRARYAVSGGMDGYYNLVNYFISQGKTIDEFAQTVKQIGEMPAKAAADLSVQAFGSPMMYALQRVYASMGMKVDDMVALYHSADIQRAEFARVLDITGEDPGVYLNKLADEGGAEIEYKKLVDSLGASDHPLAKPLLDEINKGSFTAENLRKIADVFAGEDAVAWHPDQFMAGTMGKMFAENAGDWAVKAFGVEKVGSFNKFMGLMKKAQSLMLLGFNPAYFVNNTINNAVSRMVTGVFGYDIFNARSRFYERIGYYPERYKAGIGIAGAEPEMALAALKEGQAGAEIGRPLGERPMPEGEIAIRAKLEGSTGNIGTANRILGSINNKIGLASKGSKAVESLESQMSHYYAAKKAWQVWESGRWITKMPESLRTTLSSLDPALPDALMGIIRSSMNPGEIMQQIVSGVSRYNPNMSIDNIAHELIRLCLY